MKIKSEFSKILRQHYFWYSSSCIVFYLFIAIMTSVFIFSHLFLFYTVIIVNHHVQQPYCSDYMLLLSLGDCKSEIVCRVILKCDKTNGILCTFHNLELELLVFIIKTGGVSVCEWGVEHQAPISTTNRAGPVVRNLNVWMLIALSQ